MTYVTQLHDPIVDEVRRIRDQQAAEENYDLNAIFERARRRQRQSKRQIASFSTAPGARQQEQTVDRKPPA